MDPHPGERVPAGKSWSSSRNRVYPDSHSGISRGHRDSDPGPTPDVEVTLTLVGVTAVQWLGPRAEAGSVLTLTWASRVILDSTLQGPEDLSPELRGLPHPQLCLVGRGRNRCAASLLLRRLPCRYLQRRPPRPHRARAGASRARPTFAWSLQKLTAPSRAQGAALLKPPRSPVPTPCATPALAPLCVSRHFLVPPSRRPPGPARPSPGCQGNQSDARRGQALGGRRRQGWARGAPGAADHGAPQ